MEEIEKALDAPRSYDFALDLQGQWHVSQPDGTTKPLTPADKAKVTRSRVAPNWSTAPTPTDASTMATESVLNADSDTTADQPRH